MKKKIEIIEHNKDPKRVGHMLSVKIVKGNNLQKIRKNKSGTKKPKLTSFQQMVVERFDKIDDRLNGIENRLDKVEGVLVRNKLK
ncbi:MAG: hypothetical protein LBS95_01305 [Mycoplasmataceae bacterium]|jgi:hypothetical protein|nr:hypothetical protein [Mycoplasmataceae bacterium]